MHSDVGSFHQCWFCDTPAHIEPGHNSWLIHCDQCQIQYEIELTTYATNPQDPLSMAEQIRTMNRSGREWPLVAA